MDADTKQNMKKNGRLPGSGSSWRQLVRSHVNRDRAELGHLKGAPEGTLGAVTIKDLLQRAESVTSQPGHLRTWWSGSDQDEAWMLVHEAEARIDERLRPDELAAHAEDLVIKGKTTLPLDDPRLLRVQRALLTVDGDTPLDATHVAHLARAINATSDERYAQSRSFRNRLIRLSIISLIAWGLLMVVFASRIVRIQLAEAGSYTALQLAGIVSVFGLVGAFIAGVPPLAKVAGTWNPFSLPFYQMLLKLVLGPIFAIVGVMMLQSGVIPNIVATMSLPDLLVWAVVFGAAQHVVTRLVDDRVAGMVSSEPSERLGSRRKAGRDGT